MSTNPPGWTWEPRPGGQGPIPRTIGTVCEVLRLRGLPVPLLLQGMEHSTPDFPIGLFRLDRRPRMVQFTRSQRLQHGWEWDLRLEIDTDGGACTIVEKWIRPPHDTTANRHLFTGQAGRRR